MFEYKPQFTHSNQLGHSFWLTEEGTFMSAPTFEDNTVDLDNAIAVEDWESFSELTPDDLSHLFGYILKVCMCKRDYVRVDYYANLFGGVNV